MDVTLAYSKAGIEIFHGDCRELLSALPSESVQCCVTSPPYWGLRDYGTARWEGGSVECDHKQESPRFNGPKQTVAQVSGHASKAERNGRSVCQKCGATSSDQQLGLERTPQEYVDGMVDVFREVRRVLKDDGTLWLNLGDSYAGSWGAQGRQGESGQMAGRSVVSARQISAAQKKKSGTGSVAHLDGLKAKDLVGIPWRVALARQSDGWYLRSDIIWHKPNPMPESVTDRPTKAHEYLFLLSKSERYFYDIDRIRETPTAKDRRAGRNSACLVDRSPTPRKGMRSSDPARFGLTRDMDSPNESCTNPAGKNRRSVWTVATAPYAGAHFATFPPKLIEPCILAGCPKGQTVLDPFSGACTTGLVAREAGCKYIGLELNAEYIALSAKRLEQGLLNF